MARPGQLDQMVIIQSYRESPDGMGGNEVTWRDVGRAWANVKAGSGNEELNDSRTNATGNYTFTIRNRSDLDERMRIIWGGSFYNIRSIFREGGRALYLKIDAERGVES